jgi:peptide/nickel transport system ATP-binding protein
MDFAMLSARSSTDGPAPMSALTGDSDLLDVRGLCVELPTEQGYVRIVDDVSFSIAAGQTVGLAGESGSGKTMTALTLMRLLPRKARVTGSIRLSGRELLEIPDKHYRDVRGQDIAMVFQEPTTSLHPLWTVGEQIAEAVRAHAPIRKKVAWDRAVEMLDLVRIPDPARRAKQYPHEFSGGMQQRAMIAMALSCRPKLLIADEPTTSLDVTVQAQIAELLASLQRELGMAVLFVTHDLELLAMVCEWMLVMYAGQIVEDSRTDVICERPRHPYTSALLLSSPHPDRKGEKLPNIKGFPPRPGQFPTGCRFHPRCEHATTACTRDVPPLAPLDTDSAARCIRAEELVLPVTLLRDGGQ